jgi:hypothetical protein
MARNGSDGTYSLADTVAPATLADANQVMTILNDIKTALTSSVASDGQTPITGQLKGLVSANPVYSFNADSNTGLGSDTADEAYVMCGGTKIGKFSSAGFNVLSGDLLVAGNPTRFPGEIALYAGAAAPTGWVLAHGGSIGDASSGATVRAAADCLNLFTVIWNTSNQASGTGQVQDSAGTNTARGASAAADFAAHKRILLPDHSERTPRGRGTGVVGQAAGSAFATILQANLPAVNFTHSGTTLADPTHGHGVTDPTHLHGGGQATTKAYAIFGGVGTVWGDAAINTSGAATGISVNAAATGISVSAQGSAASGGSGTALTILPQVMHQTYVIKL